MKKHNYKIMLLSIIMCGFVLAMEGDSIQTQASLYQERATSQMVNIALFSDQGISALAESEDTGSSGE